MQNDDSQSMESGAEATSVVVADDHLELCEAVACLLSEAGFAVVGRASTGAGALELIERLRPDVSVIDLRLPDLSALDVARRLRACRVVVHATSADAATAEAAAHAGALGLVLKGSPPERLVEAVRAASLGVAYWDPDLRGA